MEITQYKKSDAELFIASKMKNELECICQHINELLLQNAEEQTLGCRFRIDDGEYDISLEDLAEGLVNFFDTWNVRVDVSDNSNVYLYEIHLS